MTDTERDITPIFTQSQMDVQIKRIAALEAENAKLVEFAEEAGKSVLRMFERVTAAESALRQSKDRGDE